MLELAALIDFGNECPHSLSVPMLENIHPSHPCFQSLKGQTMHNTDLPQSLCTLHNPSHRQTDLCPTRLARFPAPPAAVKAEPTPATLIRALVSLKARPSPATALTVMRLG